MQNLKIRKEQEIKNLVSLLEQIDLYGIIKLKRDANNILMSKKYPKNMKDVFYLCDGKREGCGKHICYKNGGMCKHTKNINNAINFQETKHSFREIETSQGYREFLDVMNKTGNALTNEQLSELGEEAQEKFGIDKDAFMLLLLCSREDFKKWVYEQAKAMLGR